MPAKIFKRRDYGIIYIITNTVNDKVYVGQSWKSEKARWIQHQKSDRNLILKNAIVFYGAEMFRVDVVMSNILDQKSLDCYETFWIISFNSCDKRYGYNIRSGGARGLHTQQSKLKIANTLRGRKRSVETINKMRKSLKEYFANDPSQAARLTQSRSGKIPWNKGKTYKLPHVKRTGKACPWKGKTAADLDFIKKTAKAKIGHIVSQETRLKISNSLKLYSEQRRQNERTS